MCGLLRQAGGKLSGDVIAIYKYLKHRRTRKFRPIYAKEPLCHRYEWTMDTLTADHIIFKQHSQVLNRFQAWENTSQVFSILSSRKRLIDTYIIGDDPVEAGDPGVPLQSWGTWSGLEDTVKICKKLKSSKMRLIDTKLKLVLLIYCFAIFLWNMSFTVGGIITIFAQKIYVYYFCCKKKINKQF